MYNFKIRDSGDGVVISGFPEVDYGMEIEDLIKLGMIINDYLYLRWKEKRESSNRR